MRNILFDWSGTLVDDLPPVLEATNAVLRHYGRPEMARDEFRREFSLPFTNFYDRHTPEADIADLDRIFRKAMRESAAPVRMIPHARAFLERCAADGRRLFVLSSAPEEGVAAQAEQHGLTHFFETVYAGVRDKTARIGSILTAHGLAPDETVMIGDMQHDVHAARAAGIRSVAVLTGYEFPEVVARAVPDVTVADLSHLAALLDAGRRS